MFFSRLLGQRRGAIAAAVGIGLYVLLVGAGAAVLRDTLEQHEPYYPQKQAIWIITITTQKCWG
jgi:hypothetical protein